MFCANCGAKIADNARFCGFCGATQTPASGPDAAQASNVVPAEPVSAAPVSPVAPVVPVAENVPAAPVAPVVTEKRGADVPQAVNIPGFGQSVASPETPSAPIFSQDTSNAAPVMTDEAAAAQPAAPVSGIPDHQIPASVPPVQDAPAAAKPKAPAKKMGTAVTVVLAVVFGLLAFILGVYAFTGGVVRNGLSSGEISSEVRKIDFGKIVVGDILTDPSMADVVEKNGLILPDSRPGRATIAQVAALTINKSVPAANLTDDMINKILDKSEINKQLSEVVKSYEEYIVTGKTRRFKDGLCAEIKDLVKSTEKYVIEIANMRLAADYEVQLDATLKDEEETIEGILPAAALKKYSGLIGFALSPVTLVAALVLCVVLAVLEGLITKRLTAGLITGGAVFALIGIVLTVGSILLSNLAAVISMDYIVVTDVLTPIVYNTFGISMLTAGLICLGLGLALIAAFVVIKIIAAKRTNKAVA